MPFLCRPSGTSKFRLNYVRLFCSLLFQWGLAYLIWKDQKGSAGSCLLIRVHFCPKGFALGPDRLLTTSSGRLYVVCVTMSLRMMIKCLLLYAPLAKFGWGRECAGGFWGFSSLRETEVDISILFPKIECRSYPVFICSIFKANIVVVPPLKL